MSVAKCLIGVDRLRAFLANYLGSAYADVLPTLGEREAIFFGKASSCENPIRVRLNDRDDFLERFREANPPRKPEAAAATAVPSDEAAAAEPDDPENYE